ncbi:TetR/AcrR family transcriptional regulator [Nocardia huaxiensis]|uniref:TetR/AcrR family transcriptional regulator n=1 Tax=Nocardia huaxiensis TaxID=2755382 RepID=A0A7D6VDZ1_9NOCA|nr:TetR/AcrR family transcriptional regulator [Nocardia huaxiensis]QLY30175.1 TetR/AcrR family transcriptional regulator [Nocardia huaxiensis]UFS96210.1 TetR/AcrR family transcriptional regulator [Nocardia huaxiensis]
MPGHLSTTTRDRIVTAVAELMRTQGYSAITVKQITAAANAPMGSLYHHFPGGKLQIAAEALRTSGAAYIQLIPLLMDPHDDLRTAIPAAFEAAAETIEQSGWMNMCPVGTVAGEVADSEPALREVAAEVINSWIAQGTTYFVRRGLDEPTARDLILATLAALEGAFILSRTLRSPEPLHAAGRTLAARIDTVLAERR